MTELSVDQRWADDAIAHAVFALGPRDPDCGHTHKDFARLVRSFSTMREVPDDVLLPRFDPDKFVGWMDDLFAKGDRYDKRIITAAFLLHVFNHDLSYPSIPTFNLKVAVESWSSWDYKMFLRWVIRPWRG